MCSSSDAEQTHIIFRGVVVAVASDGKIMPPHLIETGLKTNTPKYLMILKEVLFLWIMKNHDPPNAMFI